MRGSQTRLEAEAMDLGGVVGFVVCYEVEQKNFLLFPLGMKHAREREVKDA